MANDDPFAAFQQPATQQTDPFAAFQAPAEPSAPSVNLLSYRTPGTQTFPEFLGQNVIKPVASGLGQFGGNILEDVGKFVRSNVIANLGQSLIDKSKITNPNIMQSAVSTLAQYAPFAAIPIPGLGGAGALSAIGRAGLQGALGGVTQEQGEPLDRLKSGLETGLVGAALPAGLEGLKSIPGGLQFGKNLLTPNIGQSITGNLPKDVLNKINVGNVIENYNNKLAQSSNLYNDLKNSASDLSITPSKETLEKIDSVLNRRGIDPDLKITAERYKNNPVFSTAHDLQSAFGKEAASFKSSLASTREDDITQKLLNNTRKDLNDTIKQSFEDSGNQNLVDKLNNATKYFKENVVPYRQKSSLWRIINGKEYPRDVVHTLTAEDEPGYNEIIRKHISENPEQVKSLVAQSLHTAADPEGIFNIVPLQKLLENANKMPTPIKELADNIGLSDQIERLGKVYKTRKFLKKAAPYAAGALLGYELKR